MRAPSACGAPPRTSLMYFSVPPRHDRTAGRTRHRGHATSSGYRQPTAGSNCPTIRPSPDGPSPDEPIQHGLELVRQPAPLVNTVEFRRTSPPQSCCRTPPKRCRPISQQHSHATTPSRNCPVTPQQATPVIRKETYSLVEFATRLRSLAAGGCAGPSARHRRAAHRAPRLPFAGLKRASGGT